MIRKAAAVLRGQAEEAMRLRVHLGLNAEPRPALTALDAFAMMEPLSAHGEALWEEAMAKVEHDRKDPALTRLRDIDL